MINTLLMPLACCLILSLLPLHGHANTDESHLYDVVYQVGFVPENKLATVSLSINDASLVKKLTIHFDPQIYSQIKANGKLQLSDNVAVWYPPKKNATLSYKVRINNEKTAGSYDALMTKDWAIFRGDDLVPPVTARVKKGSKSNSYLIFTLPKHWEAVNTGWQQDSSVAPQGLEKYAPNFIIDNPERNFDRPTGWIIAGKIGTRRELLGNTRVSVSAPKGSTFQRMDMLSFLTFVWPHVENAFVKTPKELLIVGAGDPMWRGGLSASNSLFLHADRPLVSENGTSAILHEVAHMVTRIRGADNDDWIAEGLAEFYAMELLYRAGGITQPRREILLGKLAQWSAEVKQLRVKHSTGPITAKAVLVFEALNQEIFAKTNGQHTLDKVTRLLMEQRRVSYEALKDACLSVVKQTCVSLNAIE